MLCPTEASVPAGGLPVKRAARLGARRSSDKAHVFEKKPLFTVKPTADLPDRYYYESRCAVTTTASGQT
jgi:hypothetical protein